MVPSLGSVSICLKMSNGLAVSPAARHKTNHICRHKQHKGRQEGFNASSHYHNFMLLQETHRCADPPVCQMSHGPKASHHPHNISNWTPKAEILPRTPPSCQPLRIDVQQCKARVPNLERTDRHAWNMYMSQALWRCLRPTPLAESSECFWCRTT